MYLQKTKLKDLKPYLCQKQRCDNKFFRIYKTRRDPVALQDLCQETGNLHKRRNAELWIKLLLDNVSTVMLNSAFFHNGQPLRDRNLAVVSHILQL